MDSHRFMFPSPKPWLEAVLPPESQQEVDAWATWIPSLMALIDEEWNQRQREEARDAFLAGRMARVPCGPPPTSGLDEAVVVGWLSWAATPVEDRFSDTAWASHIMPWAREVAEKAGFKGAWRHPHVDAISMAILLMMRLDGLRQIPRSDPGPTDHAGAVRKEQQKAVWRECVRIRQYLADMLPIAEDLPRRARGPFKLWWFSCLEWTRQAEKKGAGLWKTPVSLSRFARAHIRWQRWFGKLAFR